ncbi:MAG: ice-binding family protein [Firmicutes bacterium]|nr:ice-binding family protein [Bacillota bacterium]
MITRNKKRFLPLLLTLLLALTIMPALGMAAPSTVNLGTAKSFAVLAGSTITNTGPTTIGGSAGGDVGLHPGDDPTIAVFPGQEAVTLSGTVHLFDAVAQQAKLDLGTAYNDAAGRTTDETISGDLGGQTLIPGVYTSGSTIGITGTLTLDAQGDSDAVFIFQAASALTAASGSKIELINGAQPCRIFWQVGSSATLKTGSKFVGHILAMASITAETGATVQGQLLAQTGAVTLDTNVITNELCAAPTPTPTPTPIPVPPTDDQLPKTGGFPVVPLYLLGAMMTAGGVLLKRKTN